MSSNTLLVRCRSCGTLNRVPENKLSDQPVCGQCRTRIELPREPMHVTTGSYDQQVRDWPEYVLAEFWARWCGHCRRMEPYVNQFARQRPGRFKVIRVDVDAEQLLAARLSIKATPTFVLYHNGTQIGRFDGAPVQDIELGFWIDQTIAGQAPHA